MITPVILAGGSGSRLWPLSRRLHPKQYLHLVRSDMSMLQQTLARLEGFTTDEPILICSEEHRFLAAEQLRQLGSRHELLLEPSPRNTAPAITLAALHALKQADDALLLVLPADHSIQDVPSFHRCLAEGQRAADSGYIVVFGSPATSPHTGYGYIKCGEELIDTPGRLVAEFLEKPDRRTAEHLIADGAYMWNSGIFMVQAHLLLQEMERFRPSIVKACKRASQEATQDIDFIRVGQDAFLQSPSESIDRAVIENSDRCVAIPLDIGWSDVGSWSALWEILADGPDANVLQGDVLAKDTAKCFIRSESRLVAAFGVQDLAIIETKDAVLVADKARAQDIRSIVDALVKERRSEELLHAEVYRPWGAYESVDSGGRYKVKRITVKPGEGLSLQMHHHRAEHWVIVSGIARVRRGERTYLISENESTFIPVGEVHCLENPGVIPLEMIEVQSGSYLGEDDIVRFQDRYGRIDPSGNHETRRG